MMDIRSLLLLLYCTAVTVSKNCTQEGAVEIFGVQTDTLLAGRLEICVEGQWFAVYAMGWGNREAQVVCREKRFGNAEDDVAVCSGSCFGASELTQGYQRFDCTGNENALINCSEDRTDRPERQQGGPNAGVICRRPQEQATSQCHIIPAQDNIITTLPDMTTPPDCVPTIPVSTTNEQEDTGTDSIISENTNMCTAVTAVLGTLSAILLLTLVGVVLMWVWSCHRNRERDKQKPAQSDNTLNNPTYAPTTSLTTSPYSMLGPRDAPPVGHTPSSREEGEVTEDNYEVPVQDQRNSETYEEAERYEMTTDQDYNKLQHL